MKNKLADIVEYKLSQKPAQVGLRLRSENELAGLFGVNRMRLRRSLDKLVEKGILVRYHGSGTYIRRVPNVLIEPAKEILISCEDILADVEQDGNRQLPDEALPKLTLGLWSDFHLNQTRVYQALIEGMSQRCSELGHALVIGSLMKQIDVPKTPEELATEFQRRPCDGYLTVSRWHGLFGDAYSQAYNQTRPPVVYIWPASKVVDCQPLVQIDSDEAVARAVRLLSGEGFKKIGLLTFVFPCHPAEQEQRIYRRAMEDAGLNYEASEAAELERLSIHRALDKLLHRKDPIDSLYLANDEALPDVLDYLDSQHVVPGKDLGLITLSNIGNTMPPEYNWSRLEFDPTYVGQTAVDSLTRTIQSAGETIDSLSHQAAWIAGDTHKKKSRGKIATASQKA
jgi:DNA-binding LacI/PurR family transcriptional regulator/DNA-binding transcriptional regulator YhcF (GntR family)